MTFWNPSSDTTPAGTAIALLSTDTLYLRAGISLGSGGTAGSDGITATDNTHSLIFGNLQSLSGIAYHATAFANTVTIGVTGLVWGSSGLRFDGTNNSITNAGNIVAHAGFGLSFADDFASIQNSGNIFGNTDAIFLTGGGNVIVNTGFISTPGDFCINVNAVATPADVTTIDNSGTLESGNGTAIFAGNAPTNVVNSGHIYGDVVFGTANDFYDGSLGHIVGAVNGGGGDDDITMGAGRDRLSGGGGSDTLDGGAGRDRFVYAGVGQSGGTAHDTIIGFDARKDAFDLDTAITGIDATVASGALNAGTFATDVKNAVGAGQLAAGHAVLFTATSGDLAGHTILVVDRNGAAGFQTGNKDYVFDLRDADNLGALDRGDFI